LTCPNPKITVTPVNIYKHPATNGHTNWRSLDLIYIILGKGWEAGNPQDEVLLHPA